MTSPTKAAWRPTLGAWPSENGISFCVWAPEAHALEVILEDAPERGHPLEKTPDGFFRGEIAVARVGSLYRYRVDGRGPYPDPVSRCRPPRDPKFDYSL